VLCYDIQLDVHVLCYDIQLDVRVICYDIQLDVHVLCYDIQLGVFIFTTASSWMYSYLLRHLVGCRCISM
jgi:hypothetical protein